MRSRQGMTIIEVLVAVTLLTSGLLALVASAATGARLIAAGQRGTRLAAAAGLVISEFHAADCQHLAGGERTIAPFSLRWTVGREGPVASLSLVVDEPDGPRRRTVRFVSARWCEAP